MLWQFFYTFKLMKNSDNVFSAIRNSDLLQVQDILETSPNLINAKDQRGSTPLILAAYYNEIEIVSYFLKKGAPIDDKDASGNTALMGVCFKGFTELAMQLINAGANVNETNAMGASCLIYAATFNREEIAKILLEKGADTEIKDARGNTALDHAKMQGITSFIELLENYKNG